MAGGYLLEVFGRHAQCQSKALKQLVDHRVTLPHERKSFIAKAWTVVIHRPVFAPLPLIIGNLNALLVVGKPCAYTQADNAATPPCVVVHSEVHQLERNGLLVLLTDK